MSKYSVRDCPSSPSPSTRLRHDEVPVLDEAQHLAQGDLEVREGCGGEGLGAAGKWDKSGGMAGQQLEVRTTVTILLASCLETALQSPKPGKAPS